MLFRAGRWRRRFLPCGIISRRKNERHILPLPHTSQSFHPAHHHLHDRARLAMRSTHDRRLSQGYSLCFCRPSVSALPWLMSRAEGRRVLSPRSPSPAPSDFTRPCPPTKRPRQPSCAQDPTIAAHQSSLACRIPILPAVGVKMRASVERTCVQGGAIPKPAAGHLGEKRF